MLSWKAWVQRPSGINKRERDKLQALKVSLQNCLLKGEKVLQERITKID